MRQFASTGFRLWNLSREAKVVYSFFGLFSLLALFVSALFYEDLVGAGTAGIRGYYAGEAAPARPEAKPPASAGPDAGPAIELPGELPGEAAEPAAARPITVAVTYRKLLEVTHFHLFTVPVFLLIIAHLFLLTGLPPSVKMGFVVGGFLSGLLHLGAPWLVRYGGAGWAWSYAASGAGLALTTTVMTVYPVWAMWLGRPPPRPEREAREEREARPATEE